MKKQFHLILSSLILIPIAIAYGLSPNMSVPFFTEVIAQTTDLKNILRAIMGLYLAMVGLWLMGTIQERFWFAATISNILFMGGLAMGRLISLGLDGMPSYNFFLGMFLEFGIALWGIYNLKKYGSL